MDLAKCIYKYENHMLPSSFDNYFIKLESIHNYSTRQKSAGGFFYRSINSEFGRKRLHRICLKVWESISDEKKNCSFSTFKRRYKSSVLTCIRTRDFWYSRARPLSFFFLYVLSGFASSVFRKFLLSGFASLVFRKVCK